MLTCTVKLWAEQRRKLSTAVWRIMVGHRTTAGDQEDTQRDSRETEDLNLILVDANDLSSKYGMLLNNSNVRSMKEEQCKMLHDK